MDEVIDNSRQRLKKLPAIIFLLLTLFILLIVILALNYFGTVKLPEENFGFLPTREENPQNVNYPYKANLLEKSPTAVAFSERPDYQVTITNQAELMKLLNNAKVWDQAVYVINDEKYPVRQTVISLASLPQVENYTLSNGQILFSYSIRYKDESMLVSIYLPDNILQEQNVDNIFGSAVIYTVEKIILREATYEDKLETQTLFHIERTPVGSPTGIDSLPVPPSGLPPGITLPPAEPVPATTGSAQ